MHGTAKPLEEPSLRVDLDHFLADPLRRLSFPPATPPAISVILVTHSHAACAYRCLESLLAHGGRGFELILAVTDPDDLRRVIVEKDPGDAVTLDIRRGDSQRTVVVTLGRQPAQPSG